MPSSHVEDLWFTTQNGVKVETKRHGRGKRWRARFRVAPGSPQETASFERKIDAEQWRNDKHTDVNTGRYVDPKLAVTRFGGIADEWFSIKSPNWSETTKARNRSVLDNHVLSTWKNTRMVDITHKTITKWMIDLPGSSASVRKAHSVFSGVLDLAVQRKMLAVNPARQGIELPSQPVAARRYLSMQEVEDLAAAVDGERRLIVYTLAYCGLRIGELAGLRVGDVQVEKRRLLIERSVTEVNGTLVWSTPKDNERRSVPVPAFLMDLLAEHIEDRGRDEQLFPSPKGGVLRVRNMRRGWFDEAVKSIGREGLVPHELRHTAASLAVNGGASVLVVQRMLGHSKPSITLDVYSDLFDADLDSAAERLNGMRSELLSTH